MSSIYKKGRDGYFYYQAYIYNPSTNKKNKRVFKALGTKDYEEAKRKKIELDLFYKDKINQKSKSLPRPSRSKLNIFKYLIFIAPLYLIFFWDMIPFRPKKTISEDLEIENNKNELDQKSIETLLLKTPDSANEDSIQIYSNLKKSESIYIAQPQKNKLKIPDYSIERMVNLSESFNQIKIFVTIEKQISDSLQFLLCKEIKNQYGSFSHILICLYSNDIDGINLAKGEVSNINIGNQKESWLAMYTFNSVEGEFFDNNPNSYLRTFK